MVLRLKTRESRSLPGLPSIWIQALSKPYFVRKYTFGRTLRGLGPPVLGDAGWSSPVARQAHNLKVAGSNPAPATKLPLKIKDLELRLGRTPQKNLITVLSRRRILLKSAGLC